LTKRTKSNERIAATTGLLSRTAARHTHRVPQLLPMAQELEGRMAAQRHALIDDVLAPHREFAGPHGRAALAAMRDVRRHRFTPLATTSAEAYADRPLGIGQGQTISQPFIVAAMTALACVGPTSRVLEIGTGSGYQAAVLAALAGSVHTVETLPTLQAAARAVLDVEGYGNIQYRVGDGFGGWPEAAPFDAIVVTAAPRDVPPPLLQQLADGGRLIIPVGGQAEGQELVVFSRRGGVVTSEVQYGVRFVPMVGLAERDAY
jgi:protein-L-isoaspartate(D-aspartate) O-methyltransferase